MTLRAGSYDKARPDWKGLIRDDSYPVYECYHWGEEAHKNPKQARECAAKALAYIKEKKKLPKGWTAYENRRTS